MAATRQRNQTHAPSRVRVQPTPAVISVDHPDGVLHLEGDATAEACRRSFGQLRASALSSQQPKELIPGIMRDLARGVGQ